VVTYIEMKMKYIVWNYVSWLEDMWYYVILLWCNIFFFVKKKWYQANIFTIFNFIIWMSMLNTNGKFISNTIGKHLSALNPWRVEVERPLFCQRPTDTTIYVEFAEVNRLLYFWNWSIGCSLGFVLKKLRENFMQLEWMEWMF